MEAYRRAGRGGAGNYWSKSDVEEVLKKDSGDVESQTPSSSTTPADQKPDSQTAPPPEYLHSGRGGAGNWHKPSDLAASGLTQTNSIADSDTATSETGGKKTASVGQSKPLYRGGRGGAGNYYEDPAVEEKRREEEEEEKRKEMERRVERDVEAGLARPAKAYGGMNGGSYEMK